MITVDISNIWGSASLPDLLNLEAEIAAAHAALAGDTGEGSGSRGWMDLPEAESLEAICPILEAAERIREESDVLVVLGTGAAHLGARAVIELLQGPDRNFGRRKGDPMILFAGNSLSTRQHQQLLRQLEGRDFSLCLVSGSEVESAVAFRSLKWILERKYGTDEARRRVYAVARGEDSPLARTAREEDWEIFLIPEDVSDTYSLLSPAGLLPIAAAGIDIDTLLRGAREAGTAFDLRSFENPVWLYAAVRNLMRRSGRSAELLAFFEPGFAAMGRWWQQLFAAAEGRDGLGLFPAAAEFPADLPGMGRLIRDGKRSLFETVVRFDPPEQSVAVMGDVKDPDGLNILAGRTLADLEEGAFQAAVTAHTDGGVPVICIDCGRLDEAAVGGLLYFFQLSCAVSARTLGVDPFSGPGTEPCRRELNRLLGLSEEPGPAT